VRKREDSIRLSRQYLPLANGGVHNEASDKTGWSLRTVHHSIKRIAIASLRASTDASVTKDQKIVSLMSKRNE